MVRALSLLAAYSLVSVSINLSLAWLKYWFPLQIGLLIGLTGASLLAWYFFWAELVLAGRFPHSEVKWVLAWSFGTVVVLALELAGPSTGSFSALTLGILGFLFMAYVNLRFGAPYLFDFILPLPYILLLCTAFAELTNSSIYQLALVGIALFFVLIVAQYWRTEKTGKLERLKSQLHH